MQLYLVEKPITKQLRKVNNRSLKSRTATHQIGKERLRWVIFFLLKLILLLKIFKVIYVVDNGCVFVLIYFKVSLRKRYALEEELGHKTAHACVGDT